MDSQNFQPDSPGKIVAGPGGLSAFVPDALPPHWAFPADLWPALNEASNQVFLLEGIGRTLPEAGLLLRPLQDREAIRSSQIEGTYATARELLLFEMEPREARAGEERINDWREVWNYRRALDYGTQSELPLSLRLIRELHELLLSGVRGKDKTPGEFRVIQVAIGENRRFVPPPPQYLRDCLDQFERSLHLEGLYPALVQCYLAHYQFETIHPFADGNGRVGRLLLAIMLQRLGGLTKPWLYLSEYFEKNCAEYVQRLFEVSTRSAWTEWVEFCIRGTISQAKATVERCHRLVTLREAYRKRVGELRGDVRMIKIVDSLFEHPFVRVGDLARRLDVSYPTAKADISRLLQAGILKELKGETPRTYFAPELFDAAYADLEPQP